MEVVAVARRSACGFVDRSSALTKKIFFLRDCDPSVDTPIWSCGWIDPSCGWFGGWCWGLVDEALRVLAAGAIERALASGVDGIDLATMNLVWGHQADRDVVMVLIVPVEINAEEPSSILDAAEAPRKLRLIF